MKRSILIVYASCLLVALAGCGKKNTIGPTKDTEPPTVRFDAIASGDTLTGTVLLNVVASDDRGVVRIELFINGTLVLQDSTAGYRYEWNTLEWDDGTYTLQVKAYDAAGHVGESEPVQVEVHNRFELTLYNRIFTPIHITMNDQSTHTIMPQDSILITFPTNPDTISFSASTSGATDAGTVIGHELEWTVRDTVSGLFWRRISLETGKDLFFIYVQNQGGSHLYPFYVNYGTVYETRDDILIPADSLVYSTGYYQAFENTEVRAYYLDTPEYYRRWRQGQEFSLSFSNNQYVILTNLFLAKRARTGNRKGMIPNASRIIPAKLPTEIYPLPCETKCIVAHIVSR